MSAPVPDDSTASASSDPAPELGGLDPKELLQAGLETPPPASLHAPLPANADAEATTFVPPPQSSQPTAPQGGQSLPLPLPEELTQMLPGGHYQVSAFLGQGGMGAVYKGTQVRLKRPVAIKIMRRDLGKDFDFEARFEREAQAMAKLNHPNIVSVIDYGEAGPDYLYIVMELVDGADLMDVIRGGQMTQEMAFTLLPQICDALQFAHDHGIVHRDIKPSNIMLTRDGRIKMADFGLAKHFDADSSFRTQSGTGMGTPDYAAPEQFDARVAIDHRADIYALGVMIYQMITGQLPRGAWKPPSQRAAVAPQWDEIVSRAMQSDPSDRYQHASEVKTDVSTIPLAIRGAGAPGGSHQSSTTAEKHEGAGKGGSAPVKSRAPLFIGMGVCGLVIAWGMFFVLKKPSATSESPQGIAQSASLEPAAIKLWDSADTIPQKPGITWADNAMRVDASIPGFTAPLYGREPLPRNLLFRAKVRLNANAEGPFLSIRNQGSVATGQNYIRLVVNPKDKSVRLYSTVNNQDTLLQKWALERAIGDAVWLPVELRAVGGELTVSADGRVLGTVHDSRVMGPGSLQIYAARDGYFRDIEYVPLDQPAAGSPNPPLAPSSVATTNAESWQDMLADPPRFSITGDIRRTDAGLLCMGPGSVVRHSSLPPKQDGAVRMKTIWGDVRPSIRLRMAMEAGVDGMYQLVVWNGGHTAVLSRFDNLTRTNTTLGKFLLPRPLQKGEPYELELRAVGQTLTAKLNGKTLGSATDGTYPTGKFGMGVTDKEGDPTVVQSLEILDLDQSTSSSPSPATPASPSTVANATKDAPFVNSLGMRFVPVPITGGKTDKQRVLFSIWETRERDYEVFVQETKTQWIPNERVDHGPDLPAVNMSWEQATAFCRWLTQRERKAGRLATDEEYRLPTDHEWSCAVCIGVQEDPEKLPGEKRQKVQDTYPWGSVWPPPGNADNLWSEELRARLAAQPGFVTGVAGEIPGGYHDGYACASPVGSFAANALGLHDLGGNVREFCEDWYDEKWDRRVLRGGSWMIAFQGNLLASFRSSDKPGSIFGVANGFRVVLAKVVAPAPAETVSPTAATKEAPFVNSLGMKFVPVPITGGPTGGKSVLFSIWETRVRDYEVFVAETKAEWRLPPFELGPEHPVVGVKLRSAGAFCEWLTKREQARGGLDAALAYRLPSDHEWSCAAGIGGKEDPSACPRDKSSVASDYLWGDQLSSQWPPPPGVANLSGQESAAQRRSIEGWQDPFVFTAPVGSFPPNALGLYDLAGNASEWCADLWEPGGQHATERAVSFETFYPKTAAMSRRNAVNAETRGHMLGFRVVLAPATPAP